MFAQRRRDFWWPIPASRKIPLITRKRESAKKHLPGAPNFVDRAPDQRSKNSFPAIPPLVSKPEHRRRHIISAPPRLRANQYSSFRAFAPSREQSSQPQPHDQQDDDRVMPATPAWPPQSTPRLYVESELAPGPLRIDGPPAHYLIAVMRLKAGDPVKLFDDRTGEWLGVANSVGRRDIVLDVTERLREREAVPDLWLCAAPLKKGRIDWMVEKACELGVARIVPVVTAASGSSTPGAIALAPLVQQLVKQGDVAQLAGEPVEEVEQRRPGRPGRRREGAVAAIDFQIGIAQRAGEIEGRVEESGADGADEI
eukprot:gene32743-43757_t